MPAERREGTVCARDEGVGVEEGGVERQRRPSPGSAACRRRFGARPSRRRAAARGRGRACEGPVMSQKGSEPVPPTPAPTAKQPQSARARPPAPSRLRRARAAARPSEAGARQSPSCERGARTGGAAGRLTKRRRAVTRGLAGVAALLSGPSTAPGDERCSGRGDRGGGRGSGGGRERGGPGARDG